MQTTLYAYPASLTPDEKGRYLVRFRDLPEALTDGATESEALAEAKDCLSEALMARIAADEEIPPPSPVRRGQYQVVPEPTVALNVALHMAACESKLSAAELSRRLGIDHKEARRILDPRQPTKLPRLSQALGALGYEIVVTVHDSSRRDRLLTIPVERRRAVRAARAIRAERC